MQETFLRLLARPPAAEGAKAWLYRVGTNVVIERGRTRSRHLRLLARFPDGAPRPDAPADPQAELERGERQEAVRQALAALPPRDRAALLMRAEGFAHREIAEAVGGTTQSMGSILLRAYRKLAAELNLNAAGPP